ncbi:MAG: polyphosphate kinase 2 family protein [Verrucomicrobia bacterium]|nr:polyphosphate kinase 2 family protein [Verrucomicrobiota bacterium]
MKATPRIHGRVRLKDYDPGFSGGLKKQDVAKQVVKLRQRIGELQEVLYANASHALLIVLQGMDASGKDGTAKKVLQEVNPAGVETANFKTPSNEELAHDFLWRIHGAVPRYGNIGVFNRSHYEDVLIARVLNLVPERVWERRYEQINAFERMLTQNRVVLLKFFLHISKEEQAERLKARLENPRKKWKFAADDLKMRDYWHSFQRAYEDALSRCHTKYAPWHIVPADRKWYRNYVVAHTVVDALEALDLKWPKPKRTLSGVKVR